VGIDVAWCGGGLIARREPEAKDMDCVDSRVKFKNRAGESPATTQTAC
jgi:hypothetical protein